MSKQTKKGLLKVNRVQLTTKTKDKSRFDASGKKVVIEKDLYITEEQLKKSVSSAGKSGFMFVKQETLKTEIDE